MPCIVLVATYSYPFYIYIYIYIFLFLHDFYLATNQISYFLSISHSMPKTHLSFCLEF